MLMTTKTAKRKLLQRLEGSLLVAVVLSQAQLVLGQAIIDNGSFVQMGINAAGHLNVPGGTASMPSGSTTIVGLRYIPTNGESTAPGCLCEGWGVANADPATGTFAGYANIASDGGVVGLVVQPGTAVLVPTGQTRPESVGSAFKSIVTAGNDRVRVTHIYHPSASAHLYQVDVTIDNIGATPIGDLRYRRVMDWDIAPFTFHEWVEIHVGTAARLVRATSDGFLSANPLNPAGPNVGVPPTTLVPGSADYFSGPTDQGASFDFTFGSLAAGDSTRFTIYYGAAGNRTDALIAVADVRAQMYSLAFPSTSFDPAAGPAEGGPHVFIFAFGRVGGAPVPSPTPTGLSGFVGDQTIYLSWNPAEAVDRFLVQVERFNGSNFQAIGTFEVPGRENPLGFVAIIFAGTFPNGETVLNDSAYKFSVRSEKAGLQSPPSNEWFAVPGPLRISVPKPAGPLLFLHGFLGSSGSFDSTTHFMERTLGWKDGGLLFHHEEDLTTQTQDFDSTGDFFTVNFGNSLAHYPTLPAGGDGLAHQGVEVAHFISKLKENGVRTPLTLIAHSNGGLAARAFLLNLVPATTSQRVSASDISALITYGTPHRGADVTTLRSEIIGWGLAASALFSGTPWLLGLGVADILIALDTGRTQGARDAAFACNGNTLQPSQFLQRIARPLPANIKGSSRSRVGEFW